MKRALLLGFGFGFIALCGCGQVNTLVDAKVDAQPVPQLTSIAPTSGIVSTVLTLTGAQLGDAQGNSTVTVDGVPAPVQSWSAGQITVVVPDVKPRVADVVVTTGGGTTAPQMFRVTLPPRAYIHNQATDTTLASDTVSIMVFDPSAKTFAPMMPNVAIGMPAITFAGCDHSIVVNAPSRRLFATGGTGVAVFDIDPITGALAPVAGSPFLIGGSATNVDGVEVNKAGTRAWVASYTGVIAVFDVAANGAATQVSGSPFASPNIDVFALSDDEQFIYGDTEVSTFAGYAAGSTGALVALAGSPYSQGSFTYYMARRPHTTQLMLTGTFGLHVWTPATNGVPVVLAGSPFALAKPTSGTANGIAFTSDGNRMYIVGQDSASVVGLALAADGTPALLPSSPYMLAGSSRCDALSEDDSLLVIANNAASVSLFTLASDGVPTVVANSPFAYTATTNTSGLAITF